MQHEKSTHNEQLKFMESKMTDKNEGDRRGDAVLSLRRLIGRARKDCGRNVSQEAKP